MGEVEESEEQAYEGWEESAEVAILGVPGWGSQQIYGDCLRLEVCSNLEKLHLVRVGITTENLGPVLALVIMGRSLQLLDLSENSIGDDGATQLAVTANKLQELRLKDNNIKDAGAKQLAIHSQIPTLHLEQNGIGDGGASKLATNEYFQDLDLAQNDIGNSGASAFAQAISERATKLRRLSLLGNRRITTAMPFLVALQATQPSTVSTLNLGFCGIPREEESAVLSPIRHLTHGAHYY